MTREIASRLATRSTSRRVPGSPCSTRYWESTGTNACENAPSANSRRSRFGIRNATKNASVAMPAPNMRAITRSRKKPRTLDTMVMLLTVASALRRFIGKLESATRLWWSFLMLRHILGGFNFQRLPLL